MSWLWYLRFAEALERCTNRCEAAANFAAWLPWDEARTRLRRTWLQSVQPWDGDR